MRKSFILVMVVCSFLMTGMALAQEDIQKQPSCKYCGMDRQTFAHSRVYIEYDDGSTVGTCSIRCAALDLAINIDKSPKTIRVGDFHEKKLIDAEKAHWVMGGNKPGVMTRKAKWAFEKQEDADRFVKENGGRISTFDEAAKAAYEDMYSDTQMIRERRKMRRSHHKHD